MQKLLTIVVPMYNVEKYVRKCLGSFVMPDKEKMNSLEVLCINDGSPDHSSEIAKQFQANYPATYRVIDKTNGIMVHVSTVDSLKLKDCTLKSVTVTTITIPVLLKS